MTDSAPLIGTWKMVSRKREIIATGELIDALGPNPVGYINYGEDRRFYALVVSRDRPRPANLPLAAPRRFSFSTRCLPMPGLTPLITKRPSTTSMRHGMSLGPAPIRFDSTRSMVTA